MAECKSTGKRRYESYREAHRERAAFYQSPRFQERKGRLYIYRCEHCKGWHWGNS